jgi:hypothetical protein
MIKWLIRIIYGDTCLHEWKQIRNNEYPTGTRYLFACTKCGRFTKKWV